MSGQQPSGLQQRLRVPVFAATTVALGVAAHLVGAGARPQLLPIVLVLALVLSVARPLAGRRHRWPSLLVGVGAVQVAVHVALLQDRYVTPTVMGPGAGGQGAGGQGAMHDGWAMTAAHALAAAALAWWLHRGEQLAWAVVGRLLPRRRRPLLLFVRPSPAPTHAGVRVLLTRHRGGWVLRRGPPVRPGATICS